MKRLTILTLSTAMLIACGESTPTTDKGEEDNPLVDGKSDSFFSPTEHGELRMGIANPARITDDEQFHAWNFELSGDATIDLRTEVTTLDTVMYLYHRSSPDDSWGRFKRKNDDDRDAISSRIVHEGSAGEWRVIVKGFKSKLRGGFSLHGECVGEGCTTSSGMCEPDEFEPLPAATQWTAGCAFDIAGVLDSAPVSKSSGRIGLSEKCVLNGLERTAIDYYHEFWESIVGFDEMFRFDPDEDVSIDFEVVEYRFGTVVTVNGGGDESALSMYFDSEDRLLAAYQHNQSPTIDYYCAGEDEAPIESPDEGCFRDLERALPHEDETEREFGTVVVNEASLEHPGVAIAVTRFADQAELADDVSVTTEVITWTSIEGREVVETNIIGPEEISRQYTAWSHDGTTFEVILEADANGVGVVCD